MTTRWQSDTCDCIIDFNKNVQWLSTMKKCRLHKSLDRQTLLDSALSQSRRFNTALGQTLTEEQIELIIVSKKVNKLRIRKENLTNFDEHLPFEKPLSFFQNLRRMLRI